MKAEIVNHQNEVKIDLKKTKKIAEILLSQLNFFEGNILDISFVDENTIKNLNEKFRKIKEPTDILSFSYINSSKINTSNNKQPLLIGELIICPRIAYKNAKKLKHSFEKEIAILIAHGLLHLLGYDDSSTEKAKIMEEKQLELIEKLSF